MKIRSITYFCDPGWPLNEKKIRMGADFLKEASAAFEEAGYEVQTTRLATIPFPKLLPKKQISETPRLVEVFARILEQEGISYGSLGPALPDNISSYDVIPEAISVSPKVFFSGVMANKHSGISMEAIKACARVIVRCGGISADGFSNLQFAALANVGPGIPFFPSAYHEGSAPSFALATEAADLAVQAFKSARSISEAQDSLISAIEGNAHKLMPVADLLKFRHGVRFGGMDFSLAPFPHETRSIGSAMEHLGVEKLGLHGSLATAAILTEAIERADFHHVGFCGLFLPLLEDSTLANRAEDDSLSIKDLLMYSAVCGTGLDTIPIPGDTTVEQIVPVLLDVCALSMRLNKPLTARLMPIPGKQAGELTEFNFPYFANSRVLRVDSLPLRNSLASKDSFNLAARRQPE